MPNEKDDAIDRAMVNLIVALSELDLHGNPRIAKAEGRKYVVLAMKELSAISPGFGCRAPKRLMNGRRPARSRPARPQS
jgi:hypothetical protein